MTLKCPYTASYVCITYVIIMVTDMLYTKHLECKKVRPSRKYVAIMLFLNFKTEGSTEFITQRPCGVAPEQNKGATKGLRVIKLHRP